VDKKSETLGKLRAESASFLCFLACLVALETGAALGDELNERYCGEVEIRNQVIQGALATSPKPHDLVQGTFLSNLLREFSSSEKSALPQVRISGITVEGDVWLPDSDVWSKISINACVFKGTVYLANTAFKRGLSCPMCTFEKLASFEGSKMEGSADFSYTKFNNSVTFKDASVGDDLELDDSRFQDGADFSRLHVGSDLCLDRANFFGAAHFTHASIGKFFLIRDTFFRGTGGLSFDNLKLGEDALVKAIFFGSVHWNYGDAKGVYYQDSNFFAPLCFNSNNVSHSVSFRNCNLDKQFICTENKIDEDLDARKAHFKSMTFVSANQHAHSSAQRDTLESDFDVDFYRTKVGRVARFDGATLDGSVSLERTDLQDLDITSIKPWPRKQGTTRLADSTVKYFHAGPLEADGWRTLLTFVDNAEYDGGLYIQLEQFLKARGDPEQADDVFIRGQERAKDERLQPFSFSWIRSWILGVVTAHGRRPWRALAWTAGFVLVGAIVFWRKEDMEVRDKKFEGRKYNPIWYSFDLFVPIIQVEAASVWAPKPDKRRKWLYLRIHRLLGWILVPIVIVATTGLLQGSTS
jgi:hypothetical protein